MGIMNVEVKSYTYPNCAKTVSGHKESEEKFGYLDMDDGAIALLFLTILSRCPFPAFQKQSHRERYSRASPLAAIRSTLGSTSGKNR
jgi:hypothetical protein